jgi:acetyl-CoA acetyltransferase
MTRPVRVSIIGVGTTRHVLHYPRLSWLEMLNLAVKDALEDAGGIDPADIEAGVVAYHGEVMTETGNIGPEVSAGIGAARAGFTQVCAACSGGAAAVILAPEADSKYAVAKPVYLDGIAYACGTGNLSCYFNKQDEPHNLAGSHYTRIAAQKAYRTAGIGPGDIDLVQVSDATAVIGMMQLEGLGLCGPGEAGAAVLGGETAIDGRFPTNTYGGSIGCGHASGASALTAVIECVTQLRGEAGQRQVKNPKIAVAQSSSGANSGNTVVVLRRE